MVGGAGLLRRPERREFSGGLRGNRMEPCNYSKAKEERKIKGNGMAVNVVINRANHKRSLPGASQWPLALGTKKRGGGTCAHRCLLTLPPRPPPSGLRLNTSYSSTTSPELQPERPPETRPGSRGPADEGAPETRRKFLQDLLWGPLRTEAPKNPIPTRAPGISP